MKDYKPKLKKGQGIIHYWYGGTAIGIILSSSNTLSGKAIYYVQWLHGHWDKELIGSSLAINQDARSIDEKALLCSADMVRLLYDK